MKTRRVRTQFGQNCAFGDTSIIMALKFDFDARMNIRYGAISTTNKEYLHSAMKPCYNNKTYIKEPVYILEK